MVNVRSCCQSKGIFPDQRMPISPLAASMDSNEMLSLDMLHFKSVMWGFLLDWTVFSLWQMMDITTEVDKAGQSHVLFSDLVNLAE